MSKFASHFAGRIEDMLIHRESLGRSRNTHESILSSPNNVKLTAK